jgi:hypothetical protein
VLGERGDPSGHDANQVWQGDVSIPSTNSKRKPSIPKDRRFRLSKKSKEQAKTIACSIIVDVKGKPMSDNVKAYQIYIIKHDTMLSCLIWYD